MIYSLIFLAIIVIFGLMYLYLSKTHVVACMYHRIADIKGKRNATKLQEFIRQLDYIVENNFNVITMRDWYDFLTIKKPLPKKPILLTFDDACLDVYTQALPELKKRNLSAIVFVITNEVGVEVEWEGTKTMVRRMNEQELLDWQKNGMEIGSHTANHTHLAKVSESQAIEELVSSKKYLDNLTGKNTEFFCYPYGGLNDNAKKLVKEAGYLAALAIHDQAPLMKLDLYALPRIAISSKQSFFEFKLKMSSFCKIMQFTRSTELKISRLRKKLFKK